MCEYVSRENQSFKMSDALFAVYHTLLGVGSE